MASNTDDKSKVKYDSEIITSTKTFEKPLDFSKIPVFTIENCEVLNSSLGSLTPKFGHSIQILLPADTNLIAQDKIIKNNYLLIMQKKDPNIESVRGSIKIITSKDVLEKKYDEKLKGRTYVDIKISNAYMFDKTKDENGKDVFTKLDKADRAIGEAVVKYFRIIDRWAGEGVNPEVFKYENGEKVKSFINPKTKQETPFYVGRGDLVNIKIRPYGTKDDKKSELSLKYNLLSVEIVQTAWDRGVGRKASKSNIQEAPDSVDANALDDIFGEIMQQPVAQAQPAVQQAQPVAQPTVAQQSVQPQPVATAPVQTTAPAETPATNEVPILDFSALANMNFGNVNLGE